jgi:predicted signal transduction protein with EAL and GGDEF domain
LEDGDVIARLGGDEFAVVTSRFETCSEVADLVNKLQSAVRNPFEVAGHRLSSDASIGIAIAPNDAEGIDDLIRHADLAMYAAKLDGRRTHRFFERSMTEKAKARLSMEQELRKAISANGFEVHYQPIVDLNSAVVCCEALLRWRHPIRGMISPADFIPVAEDTGLIMELGSLVLRVACAEAATWPAHVRIAINVSPMQLKATSFALTVAGALMSADLDPSRLVIEITEAVLIGDDDAALPVLHELRGMGIKIALDDFGTGYSSLSYLRRFPFEQIKIDRSFVKDLETKESLAVVEAVVNIAAASGMTTTAEGVETEAQRLLLSKLGCTHLQGYLFSAAMPGVAIARRLRLDEPLATYQAASPVGS